MNSFFSPTKAETTTGQESNGSAAFYRRLSSLSLALVGELNVRCPRPLFHCAIRSPLCVQEAFRLALLALPLCNPGERALL